MNGVPSSAAIDIGRQKLPMPVQLLGRIRLVVNVDRDWLAFFEAP
jgi:hypothetical protein